MEKCGFLHFFNETTEDLLHVCCNGTPSVKTVYAAGEALLLRVSLCTDNPKEKNRTKDARTYGPKLRNKGPCLM